MAILALVAAVVPYPGLSYVRLSLEDDCDRIGRRSLLRVGCGGALAGSGGAGRAGADSGAESGRFDDDGASRRGDAELSLAAPVAGAEW